MQYDKISVNAVVNVVVIVICFTEQSGHDLRLPLRFLNAFTNTTVGGLENQDPRFQWGSWSSCPDKCGGEKTIKIRKRICPGQRSGETGVCLKPTMQWSWCKPKACIAIGKSNNNEKQTPTYQPINDKKNKKNKNIQTEGQTDKQTEI